MRASNSYRRVFGVGALAVALVFALSAVPTFAATAINMGKNVPVFKPSENWLKLPNNWVLGGIEGISIDSNGHVWVSHLTLRPASEMQAAQLGDSGCCNFAPPIIELDEHGNYLRGWGGPGLGYDWPTYNHGLFVDHNGFVWIGGNGQKDGQVLKFTRDGKFVLQIGRPGVRADATSKTMLGRPANMFVDPKTNELYVADGYGNRRIIVFDAATGAFRRMWGAYGKAPADRQADALNNFYNSDPRDPRAPPSPRFNSPVHCVTMSRDRLVYVCDRTNNRVQVFRPDGRFVSEFFFEKETALGGLVTDLAFWPDARQTYIFAGDGNSQQVHIARRSDGKILSSLARHGKGVGEIELLHMIAMDKYGNLYTGDAAKRLQRWVPDRKPVN